MSRSFQNRLVGTIVFVALMVIFLPELLDGKKQTYKDTFQQIPPAPSYDLPDSTVIFPQQEFDEMMPKSSLSDEQAIDDQLTSNTPNDSNLEQEPVLKDAKTGLSPESHSEPLGDVVASNRNKEADTLVINVADEQAKLPEKSPETTQYNKPAWVVQLGSFKHKKNVESLVSNLKREGYLVFTKPIETQSGTLTKVFVGPDLDKTKLESAIPALKKLTNLSGKLAVYTPAN
ncbi:DedD protein [Saccharobesus litoralis]|uniref:DedD protein n=1 Tax=Saccharobesus litoralis TaxID=2172099 RepID=A0A2S0VTC6_9ALTE|nr:SPOR domain-containing protein [Saccharobesus litoralis]AWB67457.1 DedD protein [Saccharobesus litoralis]